jgi:alginate O-acetyltransferase complex protein AlgI
MLFLTAWFVLFAAAVFPCYWLLRYPPLRRLLLLGFSAVFHTHFAGPAGVLPIAVLGVMTYLLGLTRRRWACAGGAALCVAALVFYKYTRFLCLGVVGALAGPAGQSLLENARPWLPAAAPLAISFFVFEFVHYLVEVGRGQPPIRDPIDFGLFALFWPSIVAGPVKRYEQFLPALAAGVRRVHRRDVAVGLVLVALGLVKKFAADNLTAYVEHHDRLFAQLPLSTRWQVFVAIGLRILWDFSGYSDMAIGFARMFGVRLPRNFNWPYLATSLTEFWRRWHISLSNWIRDYVYIAVGGGRHGPARKIASGLVAFAVCGLWHGAALNFVVWGIYHGVGLAVASNLPRGRFLGRVRGPGWAACERVAGWAVTLLVVHVGWLLFFYPVGDAWQMLRLLFPTGWITRRA